MSWWDEIGDPEPALLGTEPRQPEASLAIERRRDVACTRRELLAMAGWTLVTAAIVFAAFRLVLGLSVVKGDSMEPALHDGDLLVLWKPAAVEAGDVVLFRGDDGLQRVKRVVAMPGQKVEIDGDGGVLVDGQELDEPYVYEGTARKAGTPFPLVLGEDEYFVLGDHRGNSQDSRNFGPVKGSRIEGKVTVVLRSMA